MDVREALKTIGGVGSHKMAEFGFVPLFCMMLASLLCSIFIAFLYTRFYQQRATGSSVHRSFHLLGPSITAIFITIQFSLPLSLGLLGALSVIRFRTPIKEPEEIGFIILVVAAALCCATFNIFFLGIVLLIAVCGLFLLNTKRGILKRRLNDGMLVLSIPSEPSTDKKRELLSCLDRTVPNGRLESITETEAETVITYGFLNMDRQALLATDAVKAIADSARVEIFFNHAGQV